MKKAETKPKTNGKQSASSPIILLLAFAVFLCGIVGGGYYSLSTHQTESDPLPAGNMSLHFLELGNAYTGDCTYIKAGDNDILIDAGSRADSVSTIDAYLSQYVTDGKLEYVIVTHAHEDHYGGFATGLSVDSIFDLYECETIIDFAMTNHTSGEKLFDNYNRELQDEINAGATHYTARECIEGGHAVFDLGANMSLKILDSYYYYNTASGENDYSVCCLFSEGDCHYLFTGDLEKAGEDKLVEMNDLPKVDVYKAGHHGSKTSSHTALLSAVEPEVVCVCCCAGSAEYTSKNENQFPTQEFIDRIAPYTDKVYVTTLCTDWNTKSFTSMNGNIVVAFNGSGIRVECSASDLLLKDTDWFKNNRTVPDAWKTA